MIRLLVIADDLTGAMDTGVQFSKCAIPTLVTMDVQLHCLERPFDAEVLVVDTETRHLGAEEAYQRCFQLVQNAKAHGICYFYKKTDSTLRGNIGAELAATLEALDEKVMAFVPAFPKLGRICKNGRLYVDDQPVDKTIFGKDPFTPISSNSVHEIIGQQTDIPVFAMDHFRTDFCEDEMNGPKIMVLNAESEEDLVQASLEIADSGITVMAGSAGFASYLPYIIPFSRTIPQDEPSSFESKTLVVCGSINRISLSQVDAAERAGYTSVLLDQTLKEDSGYLDTKEGSDFYHHVQKMVEDHDVVILKSSSPTTGAASLPAKIYGDVADKQHIQIAKHIGCLTRKLVTDNPIGNLVVFGGDTLFGILGDGSCECIHPSREVFPGVTQSVIQLAGKRICLFTKAGGFGNKNTLLNLLEEISGRTKEERMHSSVCIS